MRVECLQTLVLAKGTGISMVRLEHDQGILRESSFLKFVQDPAHHVIGTTHELYYWAISSRMGGKSGRNPGMTISSG